MGRVRRSNKKCRMDKKSLLLKAPLKLDYTNVNTNDYDHKEKLNGHA